LVTFLKISSFKPAWWLFNSHLQTLWPVLVKRKFYLDIKRERIELPDKDFIDLDWINYECAGPIVVLLHGLEGSIDSHYALSMLHIIKEQKWRGVLVNFRGCSGEPNRLERSYHSGDTKDFELVLNLIKQREPEIPLAAIGYSLGGNVLLKWLGETKNNLLKAAVAVSVPFEMNKVQHRLTQGFSKLYQWYLLKSLRDSITKKAAHTSLPIKIELLKKVKSLYDFDNLFTAPLHGFTSAENYYTISSSRQYLKNITTPTLIIHSKDDPFMTSDVIPEPTELSSTTQLIITEKGGHVGFVMGSLPWRPQYWLDHKIPEFLHQFI